MLTMLQLSEYRDAGIGVMLHELAHLYGAPHRSEGLMLSVDLLDWPYVTAPGRDLRQLPGERLSVEEWEAQWEQWKKVRSD